MGMPPRAIPVRWIEAPASGTREYLQKTVAHIGDGGDVAVQSFLTLDRGAPGSSPRYHLTEYHEQSAPGQAPRLVNTNEASGEVSLDQARVDGEAVTLYRLKGTTDAHYVRTVVEQKGVFSNATVGPDGEISKSSLLDLQRAALTSAQRIEVTDLADLLAGSKIRMRVGQQLVLRLEHLAGAAWTLNPASLGGTLTGKLDREEPGRDADHRVAVFVLQAVNAGWADLSFEGPGSLAVYRVKAE